MTGSTVTSPSLTPAAEKLSILTGPVGTRLADVAPIAGRSPHAAQAQAASACIMKLLRDRSVSSVFKCMDFHRAARAPPHAVDRATGIFVSTPETSAARYRR